MADGFLGRWSRRKQEVREGLPLVQPLSPAPLEPASVAALPPVPPAAAEVSAPPAQSEPALSLEDVKSLTSDSDFKPFVARGVEPEVKNAAMKKLFADPRFNVMDGLDIYIDDYSKPDPLPASMLRQMVSAQFLKLFDEEKDEHPAPPTSIDPPADARPANPTLETAPAPAAPPELNTDNHAHTDLRLQQDHAAGAQGPGRGAE